MKSMTGYGHSTANKDGNSVTVEISSVNSRKQIDMRFSIPRELGMLEPELRQIVTQQLSRGTFQVAVTYQFNQENRKQATAIDAELAAHIAQQLREIGEKAGLKNPEPDWKDILLVPGVLAINDSAQYEPIRELAIQAFKAALSDLDAARHAEGRRLKEDLIARGAIMKGLVENIDSREGEAIQLLKTKLQERIANLGLELPIDDEKLAREVIFYVEKADITEEVVRLKSHLVKYAELLNSDGDPGRDLDFLGQEMNREVNTLSAKTADMTISEDALKLKTELSRVREQIMNIE
ncbi:MAG: YicC family protein [Victivallales bacterium]|nr:YicC family protein [Victivallales bacterium]